MSDTLQLRRIINSFTSDIDPATDVCFLAHASSSDYEQVYMELTTDTAGIVASIYIGVASFDPLIIPAIDFMLYGSASIGIQEGWRSPPIVTPPSTHIIIVPDQGNLGSIDAMVMGVLLV